MAGPAPYNLTLYGGDEDSFSLQIQLDDGSFEQFTGLVGKSQIRKTAEAAEVMAEFEVTVNTDEVQLLLTSVEAAKLTGTAAVWDLQLARADGTGVKTKVAGTVKIRPQVTR